MDFYKTKKWHKKSEAILRRDKYKCQDCRRYGKNVEATVVHHVKELEDYPELALVDSNLISLCKACHNKRHPEKAFRNYDSRRYYPPPFCASKKLLEDRRKGVFLTAQSFSEKIPHKTNNANTAQKTAF